MPKKNIDFAKPTNFIFDDTSLKSIFLEDDKGAVILNKLYGLRLKLPETLAFTTQAMFARAILSLDDNVTVQHIKAVIKLFRILPSKVTDYTDDEACINELIKLANFMSTGKKELKSTKKKHYWCDYCKKDNVADEVDVDCDECYYCKNCGHPKAWHDETMNSCFANGDNCGCFGYKPNKKNGLVKDKELKPK